MLSILSTSIFTGSEPVMSIVWRRFMLFNVFSIAACSETPLPPPVIAISVVALPLSSAAMLSLSTSWSSRNRTNCSDKLPLIIFKSLVNSAWRWAASGLSVIENWNPQPQPSCVFPHPLLGSMPEHCAVLQT
ncbi:Uncharacterised protein [uncultured archaeon]|nr:Uncharacterised protein [uncultured archaeon]